MEALGNVSGTNDLGSAMDDRCNGEGGQDAHGLEAQRCRLDDVAKAYVSKHVPEFIEGLAAAQREKITGQ